MAYQLKIAAVAQKDLAKLDKKRLEIIRSHLRRLAEMADDIKHFPLKGQFTGLYKRRVFGKYRVIYDLQREKQIIVVVRVGNRDDIYEV